MKYRIGKRSSNEIVIRDEHCPELIAEIDCEKGYWILSKLVDNKEIYVNGLVIKSSHQLEKNDQIKIGNQTIYWKNYLFEGDAQELDLSKILSYNGRVSRANYRALSLLGFGMAICIFFLPGLSVSTILKISIVSESEVHELSKFLTPIIHTIGYLWLSIAMVFLAIKRCRDTKNSIWRLFIPFYNLKILYFEKSKY